ncbi:DUF1349 domain-containing protein [Agromyces mediolanus]|uniref:DUF1349 domain-containing protein n=1 Tax=Agromyces mediolanus TaxID=41986 RepID=UPI003833DBC5
MRIPWTDGRWTREPVAAEERDGALLVRAVEGSDYWRETLYGFVHDDGHALLGSWPADAAIEVSFDSASLTELYDQAGIMLVAGPERWVKAGLELSDGVPQLGAVVTDGRSDWSMAPVPEWAGRTVTIRASRIGDAVVLRARADEGPWRTFRVTPFPAAAEAGPMICAPSRAGLEVAFTAWRRAAADTELHADPPTA